MSHESRPNPARYRELSQPFDSAAAAEAACDAFLADVEAARVKHRIADASVIAMVPYVSDQDEASLIGSAHFGDSLKRHVLAAYLLGAAEVEHREMIARLRSRSGQ